MIELNVMKGQIECALVETICLDELANCLAPSHALVIQDGRKPDFMPLPPSHTDSD